MNQIAIRHIALIRARLDSCDCQLLVSRLHRTWTERTIQIEPPTSFNMKVWILSGKKGRQEDSRERGRNKNIFAVECANMKG